MPKFNLNNPALNEKITELVNKFNNNLTPVMGGAIKDASTINEKGVYDVLAELDIPENSEQLAETSNTFYNKMIELVANRFANALKNNINQNLQYESVDKQTMDLAFNVFKSAVKENCTDDLTDSLDEIEDETEELWSEKFVEVTNNSLSKVSINLIDIEKEKAQNILDSKDSKLIKSQNDKYISSLNEKINNYRDSLTKKPSDVMFNAFMEDAAISYTMVHELYNKKNFFQKWFTNSGWKLREAMNNAKEFTNECYKKVNVSSLGKNKFDVSSSFAKYALESKKSFKIDDNLVVSAFEFTSKAEEINEERVQLDEVDLEEAEVMDVDKFIAKQEEAIESNRKYEKGYDNFFEDLANNDKANEKIKSQKQLDVIVEEDEEKSL